MRLEMVMEMTMMMMDIFNFDDKFGYGTFVVRFLEDNDKIRYLIRMG